MQYLRKIILHKPLNHHYVLPLPSDPKDDLHHEIQFSSVAQLCPTLCDPMNCSTPGLPVLNFLPKFAQTLVHLVSDAIQPSHPLFPPPSPSLSLSQHQCLFE